MIRKRRQRDERPIIPLGRSVLDSVCPDLASWPELWKIEDSDVVVGQRIVEFLEPCLIYTIVARTR